MCLRKNFAISRCRTECTWAPTVDFRNIVSKSCEKTTFVSDDGWNWQSSVQNYYLVLGGSQIWITTDLMF